MLKYYIKTTEALKRLRSDKDGMVSIEYVIVAACVVGVVVAVFSTGGPLEGALSGGLNKIAGAITNAVGS
jgi:Flp pilus assembly pilin Flp